MARLSRIGSSRSASSAHFLRNRISITLVMKLVPSVALGRNSVEYFISLPCTPWYDLVYSRGAEEYVKVYVQILSDTMPYQPTIYGTPFGSPESMGPQPLPSLCR